MCWTVILKMFTSLIIACYLLWFYILHLFLTSEPTHRTYLSTLLVEYNLTTSQTIHLPHVHVTACVGMCLLYVCTSPYDRSSSLMSSDEQWRDSISNMADSTVMAIVFQENANIPKYITHTTTLHWVQESYNRNVVLYCIVWWGPILRPSLTSTCIWLFILSIDTHVLWK